MSRERRPHTRPITCQYNVPARGCVTALAKAVAATATGIKCSASTLRVWAKRYAIAGIDGLTDQYVKPPKKIPTFDSSHARDGLLLCGLWSYRIGNVARIDTKMMSSAVALITAGYPIADLIATVDCYYSYKCDRDAYPFKPFGRWIKHDLVKWIERAVSDADYRRALRTPVRAPRRTALTPPIHRPARPFPPSPNGLSKNPKKSAP